MIIKVDSKEREMLEYVCAVFDLKCHVYTIESNSLLVQAEILHENGEDLDGTTAWNLCSCVRTKMHTRDVVNRK